MAAVLGSCDLLKHISKYEHEQIHLVCRSIRDKARMILLHCTEILKERQAGRQTEQGVEQQDRGKRRMGDRTLGPDDSDIDNEDWEPWDSSYRRLISSLQQVLKESKRACRFNSQFMKEDRENLVRREFLISS